jgi:hypothetical protein
MKSGESNPWFTARVSGVANLHLFLALAENLGRK